MNAARIPLALATLAAAVAGCSRPSGDAPSTAASSAALAAPASAAASSPAVPTFKEPSTPAADRERVLAPNTGIPTGTRVPDVHGADLEGKDVALSSLYVKGPILLAFYRGVGARFATEKSTR